MNRRTKKPAERRWRNHWTTTRRPLQDTKMGGPPARVVLQRSSSSASESSLFFPQTELMQASTRPMCQTTTEKGKKKKDNWERPHLLSSWRHLRRGVHAEQICVLERRVLSATVPLTSPQYTQLCRRAKQRDNQTDQQETQRFTRKHQLLEVGSRLPAWERKTSQGDTFHLTVGIDRKTAT